MCRTQTASPKYIYCLNAPPRVLFSQALRAGVGSSDRKQQRRGGHHRPDGLGAHPTETRLQSSAAPVVVYRAVSFEMLVSGPALLPPLRHLAPNSFTLSPSLIFHLSSSNSCPPRLCDPTCPPRPPQIATLRRPSVLRIAVQRGAALSKARAVLEFAAERAAVARETADRNGSRAADEQEGEAAAAAARACPQHLCNIF